MSSRLAECENVGHPVGHSHSCDCSTQPIERPWLFSRVRGDVGHFQSVPLTPPVEKRLQTQGLRTFFVSGDLFVPRPWIGRAGRMTARCPPGRVQVTHHAASRTMATVEHRPGRIADPGDQGGRILEEIGGALVSTGVVKSLGACRGGSFPRKSSCTTHSCQRRQLRSGRLRPKPRNSLCPCSLRRVIITESHGVAARQPQAR